jgi:hypothetical protein
MHYLYGLIIIRISFYLGQHIIQMTSPMIRDIASPSPSMSSFTSTSPYQSITDLDTQLFETLHHLMLATPLNEDNVGGFLSGQGNQRLAADLISSNHMATPSTINDSLQSGNYYICILVVISQQSYFLYTRQFKHLMENSFD